MALQEKGTDRRQVAPVRNRRDGARSGFETGWRLAHLVLLEQARQDPDGFIRLVTALSPLPAGTTALAAHLDVEPSLVRRMFRHLNDNGCTNVVELKQYGTPSVKTYFSCVSGSVAARRRIAAG